MREIMQISSLITRIQAWDSIRLKLLATWVLPYHPDHKLTDQMAELIKVAPKLDYVDVDGTVGLHEVEFHGMTKMRGLELRYFHSKDGRK